MIIKPWGKGTSIVQTNIRFGTAIIKKLDTSIGSPIKSIEITQGGYVNAAEIDLVVYSADGGCEMGRIYYNCNGGGDNVIMTTTFSNYSCSFTDVDTGKAFVFYIGPKKTNKITCNNNFDPDGSDSAYS
jgi:hypothetical protein